jgi:hypothetical protein
MAARSLAGPTLGRPYRRADLKRGLKSLMASIQGYPVGSLKGALYEEVVDNVVAEVVMSRTVADEAMKIYRS